MLLLFMGFQASTAAASPQSHYADLQRQASDFRPFDPELVPLLVELAEISLQPGQQYDLDEAEDHADRALHILHRTHGVYGIEQLPVLELLSQISAARFDVGSVETRRQFRFQVLQKHHGPYHPETVAGLAAVTRWQIATGRYGIAENSLREFLEAFEASGHRASKYLAEVYNQIAEIQYLEGRCCSEQLTQQALDVVLQDDSSDRSEKLEAVIRKMDFDLMAGRSSKQALTALSFDDSDASVILGLSRRDRVVRAYQSVLAADGGSGTQTPGAVSGAPFAFCDVGLDQISQGQADIFLRAELVISARGHAEEIRIVESNAPVKLQHLFKKVAGIARYRPKLESGQAVESVLMVNQDFTSKVSLDSEFSPAGIANVHACHVVARSQQNAIANIQ